MTQIAGQFKYCALSLWDWYENVQELQKNVDLMQIDVGILMSFMLDYQSCQEMQRTENATKKATELGALITGCLVKKLAFTPGPHLSSRIKCSRRAPRAKQWMDSEIFSLLS